VDAVGEVEPEVVVVVVGADAAEVSWTLAPIV
jgi:hypothetical protein